MSKSVENQLKIGRKSVENRSKSGPGALSNANFGTLALPGAKKWSETLREGPKRAPEAPWGPSGHRTVRAHRNISANDDNAVALARAGAIDPLVKLLGAGTSGERQAASPALRTLSLNPEADNRVGVEEVA